MSAVNTDALVKPFPKAAVRQRRGANGMNLNYLECHTVIRRIIEATGNDFSFRVVGVSFQDSLIIATVELEIGGSKRQQVGSARMNGGNNDDAVKAAISDGLKKAATLFGVGLELYGPDYEAQPIQPAQPVQARNQRPAAGGNGQRQVAATAQSAFRPL